MVKLTKNRSVSLKDELTQLVDNSIASEYKLLVDWVVKKCKLQASKGLRTFQFTDEEAEKLRPGFSFLRFRKVIERPEDGLTVSYRFSEMPVKYTVEW